MNKIRPLKNTGTTVLTYTIIFCIMMAGIFAWFIYTGKSFVDIYDAYDQGYFWTVEMRHNLHSLFSGDGYPLWSWDRGTGLDTKLPIDPFLVFASLFPAGKVELGYTLAIVLRLYFAGLAFIFFCKEVELSNFQALLGAISYVGTTWVINLALFQGQFVDLLILFPLLVMSVDRIYKGKSPAMFMLVVGITTGVNYYLAYMAAIGIIIYIFFRYFTYHDFSFKEYLSYIGRFMIYGIVGIMIGAAFILVTLQTLSGASTGSSPDIGLFWSQSEYYKTGLNLLSKGHALSYNTIGVPILGLLTIITFKGKPSIKATHMIMAMIMFGMTLFPFFGSMFNGFGYVSNRWYFMLVFFLVWCAAEHFDLDVLAKWYNVLLMLLWWGVLCVTTLGFSYFDITGDLRLGAAMFIGGNLAAGFVMILIIALGRSLFKSLRLRQTLITMAVVGTLMIVWTCSFYGHIGEYFRYGEIDAQLKESTQRAGSMIEDDGFYRIDQVDWINAHLKADQPVNENLWWQNNTIYLYDSKIPTKLSEFNKLTGNNLGYSKRVYVQSNNNRMGLDFLYGIKYFLGDDTKNDRLGADAFAGYAFDYYDTLDGVNVFKSRYDASLGFLYDKYMPESEFRKLSRLEREQALLQAVSVPDDELNGMDETRMVSASDIETDITEVPYEITATENITFDGNRFTAEKNDDTEPSFTIHIGEVKDCQLVVSFDNLRRVNSDGESLGDFKIKCKSNKLTCEVNNRYNRQSIPGIVDFDLNMGYYDTFSGNLKIKFSKGGTYEFDKLYVSAMSTANFDKYAQERCESVYHVTDRSATKVTGTIDAKDDGYLFLSMPINDNWNVFIDGLQVAEIHNANIAFFATPITKGQHDVEVRYDFRTRILSFAISITGLILTILISVIGQRRRRRQSETYKH